MELAERIAYLRRTDLFSSHAASPIQLNHDDGRSTFPCATDSQDAFTVDVFFGFDALGNGEV
jgi:hypothetical protein